jgi:S1-C subfamily serine protease
VWWVLLGAIIAIVAVVVVDRAGSSDSEQAAPTTTGPTSTTLAPAIAPRVFRTIQPSLVLVQAANTDGSTSLGSGVIVTRTGQIMTADHVIEGAATIEVTFADGTTSAALVASSEPDRDTAVLEPANTPTVVVPAVIGGGVRIGDDTYSVGNPLGLVDSMTSGVVSGLHG